MTNQTTPKCDIIVDMVYFRSCNYFGIGLLINNNLRPVIMKIIA